MHLLDGLLDSIVKKAPVTASEGLAQLVFKYFLKTGKKSLLKVKVRIILRWGAFIIVLSENFKERSVTCHSNYLHKLDF